MALNAIAYSDFIPPIDGGVALDTFPEGRMRNGIWRAHTIVPGRRCMACLGQLVVGDIPLDKEGLLDNPEYIAGAVRDAPSRQNVAALSASVSGALLAQFVSLTAHPGGRGAPAPLRYILSTDTLEHSSADSGLYCPYESDTAIRDARTSLAEHRDVWRTVVRNRAHTERPLRLRIAVVAEGILQRLLSLAK